MAQHNKTLKTTALAIGATFAASIAVSNVASAASTNSNPFAMHDLSSGYSQLADNTEGKCGGNKAKQMKEKEGKCGGNKAKEMTKDKEGKCGGNKAKQMKEKEGKCGGSK